jgi:hypothetical protein
MGLRTKKISSNLSIIKFPKYVPNVCSHLRNICKYAQTQWPSLNHPPFFGQHLVDPTPNFEMNENKITRSKAVEVIETKLPSVSVRKRGKCNAQGGGTPREALRPKGIFGVRPQRFSSSGGGGVRSGVRGHFRTEEHAEARDKHP